MDLELKPSPDGQGTVVVRMELGGKEYAASASGLLTREGDLRMGAQAALSTVRTISGDLVRAELTGVKAVRAFDAWVVIASIRAVASGRDYRLLGAKACQREDDLPRSAAIAVLDALNRVLEKLVN